MRGAGRSSQPRSTPFERRTARASRPRVVRPVAACTRAGPYGERRSGCCCCVRPLRGVQAGPHTRGTNAGRGRSCCGGGGRPRRRGRRVAGARHAHLRATCSLARSARRTHTRLRVQSAGWRARASSGRLARRARPGRAITQATSASISSVRPRGPTPLASNWASGTRVRPTRAFAPRPSAGLSAYPSAVCNDGSPGAFRARRSLTSSSGTAAAADGPAPPREPRGCSRVLLVSRHQRRLGRLS